MEIDKVFEETVKKKRVFVSYLFIRILFLLLLYRSIEIGSWPLFSVNILALFLTFIPGIIERTFSVSIPEGFEILFLLCLFPSIFMGAIWGQVLQVFLGMSLGCIGFVLMFILFFNSKVNASYHLIALFSFCFSVSLGATWEVARFGITNLFGFNTGQLSYSYTIWNIGLTIVGAAIVSLTGFLYIKYYKGTLILQVREGFIKRNPKLFSDYENSPQCVYDLIKKGEGKTIEFKSTLRTNIHTKKLDRKVEHSAMKTLAAFLNTSGGTLLVGVADDGEITGIEQDNFQGKDNYYRHFTNLIKKYTGNEYLPYIKSEIIPIDDTSVLKVDCRDSKKGVFLKVDDEEEFYVRTGPSSVRLDGSKLVSYVNQRFKKR